MPRMRALAGVVPPHTCPSSDPPDGLTLTYGPGSLTPKDADTIVVSVDVATTQSGVNPAVNCSGKITGALDLPVDGCPLLCF